MSIESDIRKYLGSRLRIQAVIGATAPKVYPVKAPQRVAAPYITIRRMSGGHQHTLKGTAGFAMPRFAIDSCGTGQTGYEVARNLSHLVWEEMAGFSGPFESVHVQSIICTDDYDDYEPPEDGSDLGTFIRRLEFQIRYTETVTAFTET